MKKSCFYLVLLVLLVMTSTAFSATKVELKSDESASAEIEEDKVKQLFSVALTFIPVTTLDPVTNDEMTGVLAQFFAEEALSSLLKRPQSIDFQKAKILVYKKTEKRCTLTYEIPFAAIMDAKVEQQSIFAETIKKYFASVSSEDLLQNFRSTCFHDLRIAEAGFLEQIKSCQNKEQLAQKINEAFSSLEKKINEDNALFLSEKEELLNKAKSVKRFLLKKLSSVNIATSGSAVPQSEDLRGIPKNITRACFSPEFQPFFLHDPNLMESGGCRAFQTENGKIIFIAVGKATVNDSSLDARLLQQEIAELNAYAELAKYKKGVEVVFFAQQTEETIKENGSIKKHSKKKTKKITLHSSEYLRALPTVGTWYSADGKAFYLAKGMILKYGERE